MPRGRDARLRDCSRSQAAGGPSSHPLDRREHICSRPAIHDAIAYALSNIFHASLARRTSERVGAPMFSKAGMLPPAESSQ